MNSFKRGPLSADVTYSTGDKTSILDNRFIVECNFYDEVSKRLLEMYPHLVQGFEYTTQEVVGHEYWDGLNPLGRNLCVLVLKDLANHKDSLISELAFDDFTGFVFRSNEYALEEACD